MKTLKIFSVLLLIVCGLSSARAADISGRWTSNFDSQIGQQKYIYEFKIEGDKIVGKATFDHSMGKGESQLKDINLNGDTLKFAEVVKFEGNELTITYAGKVSGDEIKLTRTVGDFATEEIVAKRDEPTKAKAPAAK